MEQPKKGWYVRGITRNNLTGEVDEEMNIPAPDKEHYFEPEYVRRCANTDWDELHILPDEDEQEHELSLHCSCGADVRFFEEASTIIIHNSLDGREAVEWLEEIFNDLE